MARISKLSAKFMNSLRGLKDILCSVVFDILSSFSAVKQEKNGDNERRLNVSVTGGQSGPRTVVLTVPKGL